MFSTMPECNAYCTQMDLESTVAISYIELLIVRANECVLKLSYTPRSSQERAHDRFERPRAARGSSAARCRDPRPAPREESADRRDCRAARAHERATARPRARVRVFAGLRARRARLLGLEDAGARGDRSGPGRAPRGRGRRTRGRGAVDQAPPRRLRRHT